MRSGTGITTSPTSRLLPAIALTALALAAFVTALVPINSNDFWWHLNTGDYIRLTGVLPERDPFSWLPVESDPYRAQVILRRYWLAQLFYSWMYGVAGLPGILWSRALLCGGMVLGMGLFLRRETRTCISLLPLLPLVLSLRVVLEDSDRPHLFAFFGVLLAILFLEGSVRSGRRWPLYLLPPLQLLIAQLHPGFAVGTLFVGIYAVCAMFEPRLRAVRPVLWRVAAACILLFFFNPNGLRLIPHLTGSFSAGEVAPPLEFLSPLTIWRHVAGEPGWLACGGLVLLSFPAIWGLGRQRAWSAAFILSGLTLAFLLAIRYVGFFAPVAAVFAGLELARLGAGRPSRWGEAGGTGVVVLAMALIMLFPGHANRGKIRQLVQPGYFPLLAADFLVRENVQGKLFNFQAWGGYLAYRLWPRCLIFTDTRYLTVEAPLVHGEVLSDTPSGREFLERNAINTIILPSLDIHSGEVFPLVRRLSTDPQWSLAHVDDTALVFARQPHQLPSLTKEMIWFQVLRQVDGWQPRFPWVAGYQRTREEASGRMRGAR